MRANYVNYRKKNPAHVCVSFDEDVIRQDIRYTLALRKEFNLNLEFALTDLHAVGQEPWRVGRWVEIVREESRNAA